MSDKPTRQQRPEQPAAEPQGEKKEKDPRKVGRDLAASPDNYVTEGTDESYEKGFWGTRDTPFDDAEFTLTTGPHSPGAVDLEDPDSYEGKSVLERE